MPMNKEQEVFCMELQLQNLTKQYGDKCAVSNVSVNLNPGVYGLLGANVPRYEQKTLSIT